MRISCVAAIGSDFLAPVSLRLEMLQVARLAPRLLGKDSSDLIRRFLCDQQNDDGGFQDRSGASDLYYTVFGVDARLAIEAQEQGGDGGRLSTPNWLAEVGNYAAPFGEGDGLDFVHLCCLARALGQCHGGPQPAGDVPSHAALLRRIEDHRSSDGGYNPAAGSTAGTAYGCFVALGAYQDLRASPPEPESMLGCLESLRTADGAWSNARTGATAGSTNATAAAVTLLRHLGRPIPPQAADWILARCHAQGGFLAAPDAPIPDLLSTATALHALAGTQVPLDSVKEKCLDFIDSLWTNAGSFHGHWAEDVLDCEYTFYGLLALGHLSV